MIIVEGPDGGGKTYLLKVLVKQLQEWALNLNVKEPAKIIHSPGPLEQGLFQWAVNALDRAKEPVVFDRFPFFSEPVYGQILRHKMLLSEEEFDELKIRLIEWDPLVIYCRPPLATLKQSSLVMEQMGGVLENLQAIIKSYDQMFPYWMGIFRVFHYDFTQVSSKELLPTVINEFIREDYKRGGWE